jgi:hypothetical protein
VLECIGGQHDVGFNHVSGNLKEARSEAIRP